jgi:hypothetical protein
MNDIEKKLRKRALQKLDKYAHNPYHVNKPSFFSRIPLWSKIAVPASLVTAVAVVAFVGLINGVSKGNAAPAPGKNDGASHYAPAEQDTSNDKGYTGDSSVPSTAQKQSIRVNGVDYAFIATGSKGSGGEWSSSMYATVQEENLGNLISDTTDSNTGANVAIYEIKNYSSDTFIAAKYANNPNIFACFNENITFSTIDDFLNKIPFMSDSSIANQKIMIFDDKPKNKYYEGADTATINSYLFTDTGSASVTTYTQAEGESAITMPFRLNTVNSECVRIILYKRGHMRIQIADNDKNVYNVGENIYSNVRTYIETLTAVNG